MEAFSIRRRVSYYETDAMGVVHHSNHLRFFEEVRVEWFRERGMGKVTWQKNQYHFPLIEATTRFIKPIMFDDLLELRLQVRLQGTRFYFQYGAFLVSEGMEHRLDLPNRNFEGKPLLVATGTTTHVIIERNFKVCKTIDPAISVILEKESWTEGGING